MIHLIKQYNVFTGKMYRKFHQEELVVGKLYTLIGHSGFSQHGDKVRIYSESSTCYLGIVGNDFVNFPRGNVVMCLGEEIKIHNGIRMKFLYLDKIYNLYLQNVLVERVSLNMVYEYIDDLEEPYASWIYGQKESRHITIPALSGEI